MIGRPPFQAAVGGISGADAPGDSARLARRAASFEGWLSVFLIVCALILAPAFTADAAQSVGGVRVMEEEAGEGLRLSVVNSNLAAITLTITVTGQNLAPDKRMPLVVTCPGKGNFPFVLLKPARTGKSFSYRVRYDWQFGSGLARHDTSTVYSLPFASGRGFPVVQGFHGGFTHTGNNDFAVDFGMPVGTPVHAAREGTVEVVVDRFTEGGVNPELRERANFVLVRHADGTYGEYVHLQEHSVRLVPGQRVQERELIGYSGNTGYSQGPHLHFAVFRAVNGVKRETFPMRFKTIDGETLEPRQGVTLRAP